MNLWNATWITVRSLNIKTVLSPAPDRASLAAIEEVDCIHPIPDMGFPSFLRIFMAHHFTVINWNLFWNEKTLSRSRWRVEMKNQ